MNDKHTPGPWVALFDDDTIEIVSNHGARSIPVADIMMVEFVTFAPDIDDATANASLIAAAPDLLEALDRALAEYDSNTDWREYARAAIAKARGEV